MSEESRASAWREPPERYNFTDEIEQLEPYAERFNFICYLGCGAGAIAALTAAAVAWAEPVARFLGL